MGIHICYSINEYFSFDILYILVCIYIKITLLVGYLQLKRIITYGPQQNFDLSVI